MSFNTRYGAALCVAAALLIGSPVYAQTAQSAPSPNAPAETPAQQMQSTTVEFTTPTRLPGITLQPGKYVFRLGAPVTTQKIVEVYSADGTKKIASFLTVDYATPPAANATLITFDKTDPPALRVWYFPGEPIGREFVYTQDEATTLFASANTPVLWAVWDPDDEAVIGRVQVQTVGQAVGEAARAVADVTKDVARAVADVTEDVFDDIADNVRLVNPTESRKAAERHLDAAEKAFDDLESRTPDDVDALLMSVKSSLEALEDSFERDQPWMASYNGAIAAINALSPEGPVGTTGGKVTLDASTHAALGTIRSHLKAFHAQAMK